MWLHCATCSLLRTENDYETIRELKPRVFIRRNLLLDQEVIHKEYRFSSDPLLSNIGPRFCRLSCVCTKNALFPFFFS